MSRMGKAYSNSMHNIACVKNKLNKTVQFYSPEFASLLQGENTASIDESRKESVRTSFITS